VLIFLPLSQSKERHMSNFLTRKSEQSSDRVNNLVADIFNAATITIAGFLAVLTVAATV
jgi:hypothetical protein